MKNSGAENIKFSQDRWEKVKKNHRLWWEHKLGRPLIQVYTGGLPSSRQPSSLPREHFIAAVHNSPTEEILDMLDYKLSTQRFLGDAFPAEWINYGPGVVAAFLGCDLHLGKKKETVWFHPSEIKEISDLNFSSTAENNEYWNKILQISAAAGKRWNGMVQTGLTDLGGTLDVLSSFRPSEALIYDLYDEPERVEELTWEIHHRWWDFYDKMHATLMENGNPGTTCWTPIFSEKRYYMLQCDFCYMLSPEMFEKFVLPELSASCRRLDHAFYHLDGIGELPSLDMILSIPELKGIQWVPGDGQPDIGNWPEVYRKISDAGKLIQIFGSGKKGMENLDKIAQQTGRADNIVAILWVDQTLQNEAEEFLGKWGC